jgi:23S rRNA (guanine745-N1)-methyltransferase
VLADVVAYLRCPVCGGELSLEERVLRCAAGHSFDVARQGYANLLTGRSRAPGGDTAAMLAAREAFLAPGHFEPLELALAEAARDAPAAGCVVDLGAGTGRQLARVLEAVSLRPGLALDVSIAALRRAARAHPRVGAVGCDTWEALPLVDAAAGLVLNVFAPRNAAEIERVMAPAGRLLVVTPTPRHLNEIAAALDLMSVDARKPERLARELGGRLEELSSDELEWDMSLGAEDLEALVMMGPNAFHTDPRALRGRIEALPGRVEVRASLRLSVWRQG